MCNIQYIAICAVCLSIFVQLWQILVENAVLLGVHVFKTWTTTAALIAGLPKQVHNYYYIQK